MKTINCQLLLRSAFTAVAIVLAPCLFADPPPPSGDIVADTVIDPVDRVQIASTSPITYNIYDGVTLILRNASSTANGGVFHVGGNLTINASGTLGTGRVIFENNTTTGQGGVLYVNTSRIVNITNAIFRNNTATNATGGGAIRNASGAGSITLTQVLFEGNSAPIGAAIRNYASAGVTIRSGTFLGNYTIGTASSSGMGGAIQVGSATAETSLNDVAFINNRAGRDGGAIMNSNNAGLLLTNIIEFTGNWTGRSGGAIYDNNNAITSGNAIDFTYTGASGVNDIVFSGNVAGGLGSLVPADTLASGSYTMTPLARSGGFYYANNAGWLVFNIAEPVTLSIGEAGNPGAYDSLATSNSGTGAKLDKNGAGALVLHADNSYFQGTINVNEGSLLLGNQDAALGGVINVASGALFGGAGTLVTLNQSSAIVAGRTVVNASAGSFIQAGNSTATDAETLSIEGNLTLGDGVTLTHDLFTSGSASMISVAGDLTLGGSGTINIGLLATGTFTLVDWAGSGIADISNISLTIAGVTNSPRSEAMLSIDGNSLIITSTAVNNLIMHWTGAEGNEWTRRPTGAQRNWAAAGGLVEDRFFNADSVIFDGEADAANPANRIIIIDADGVVVSDMEVTGAASYEFRGEGGIEADAASVDTAAFTPAGKLKKSGSGELVFANTGTNIFAGGIEIAAGVIVFDHAAQLGSGTGGILFSDSGTLRALSTVSGTLGETIIIAAGKTAELLVDADATFVHGGTLSPAGAGATLRKTGDGTMLLTGGNADFSGLIAVDEGMLALAETALIGGNIAVASGAILGGSGTAGVGGSINVAAGGIIEAGLDNAQAATLTVHNLTLTGDAVLRLDLFSDADTGSYQKSDRIIESGTASISGVNNINLTSFASGTFNLGNLTGLAANGIVTLSGMTLPAGGRLSASLTDNGGILELTTESDQSRVMTWTGGSGSTWNLAQANWTDGGAVNQFSYGDRIIFDGSADAAHSENRNIFIDADEVRIADMTVTGDADYTFTGGGIHASADNVQADANGIIHIADATGKLIKTGNGVLTLANDKNTFTGGIEINSGILAFSHEDQLTTSDSTGITFTGNGTLRAEATNIIIDNAIIVEAGAVGAIDTNGHVLTLQGTAGGAADSTLAKDGAGTLVMKADLSGFSGTLAVRDGVLRAGAEDLFASAQETTIVVESGAAFDLDGHNQTISKLQGAGTVELGTAILTMDIGPAGAEFAGGFSGSGTVFKQGEGKWTLSGASYHSGGIVYEAGQLGLASTGALGAGTLFVEAANAQIDIEANDINIANAIAVGANGVTIFAAEGYGAEFSGSISGGTVALAGSGTLVLSGNNSNSSLAINNARTIARRAESISGTVTIGNGSILEYQNVPGGQANSDISGDTLMFISSTLAVRGMNILEHFIVGAGSSISANNVNALGGATADILVRDGGWLTISEEATLGGNVTVDGGAIVFGSDYKTGSLALSGQMNFLNDGEIRLGGLLPTGIYTAAVAGGGIANMPAYDPNQGGMFMVVDIVDGNTLLITAYNKALEPGKDIVVSFDAMNATARAVYSHVKDELVVPVAGTQMEENKASLWFRGIGTFAEYEDDGNHLGYTDDTYAGIVGYDMIFGKTYMLGGYFGVSNTRLETSNDASTRLDMPFMGIYSAMRKGNFYVAADFTLGFGNADTERREDFSNIVKGSYDLNTFGGGFETGYIFPIFFNGGIRPSIGVYYMNLSFHEYEETGKGAVRLDDIRASLLQGVVKIDTSKKIKMPWGLPGMVDLSVGWRRSLQSKRTEAWATLIEYPDARFQIRGDEYDANNATVGLGARMMLSRHMLFSLAYDYDGIPFGNRNKNFIRHTFAAMLRISW